MEEGESESRGGCIRKWRNRSERRRRRFQKQVEGGGGCASGVLAQEASSIKGLICVAGAATSLHCGLLIDDSMNS